MSNDRTQQILSHFLAAETGAAPALTKTAQDQINGELAGGFVEALRAAGNTTASIEKFASEQPQQYGVLFTEWIGNLRQGLVKQAEDEAMEKHAAAEYMTKVAEATKMGSVMAYSFIDTILNASEFLLKMAEEEEEKSKEEKSKEEKSKEEKDKEKPKEEDKEKPKDELPPWLGEPKEAAAVQFPPEVVEAHNQLMAKMANGQALTPPESDLMAKILGALQGIPMTFTRQQ